MRQKPYTSPFFILASLFISSGVFLVFLRRLLRSFIFQTEPFPSPTKAIIYCIGAFLAGVSVIADIQVYDNNRRLRNIWKSLCEENKETNIPEQVPESSSSFFHQIDEALNVWTLHQKELTDKHFLSMQADAISFQEQINPHFLYNSLESIRGMAKIEHADQTEKMIDAVSSLFRYRVGSKGVMSTLEEELENIDNYIMIQKFRFGERFQIQKELSVNDRIMETAIPRLTLQPIVENAIQHGLEGCADQEVIRIQIYTTLSGLIICISDNGVGMSEQTLLEVNKKLSGQYTGQYTNASTSGIALFNINARLKLFFGKQAGVSVFSELGKGTSVELFIPNIEDSVVI